MQAGVEACNTLLPSIMFTDTHMHMDTGTDRNTHVHTHAYHSFKETSCCEDNVYNLCNT